MVFGVHQICLGCFWGGSMVFGGISFSFGGDPVLLVALFDVFWSLCSVLVGFMLVFMVKKCKLWVLESIR